MTDYTQMTPEERFAALELMAVDFFMTGRWKTEFCRRYGLTPQTLTSWKDKGAPLWSCQAMQDALAAKRLDVIRAAVLAVDG